MQINLNLKMQYIREFPNEDYGDVPTGMDLEAC